MKRKNFEQAIERAFDKLKKMSDEEFYAALEMHEGGDVASMLLETRALELDDFWNAACVTGEAESVSTVSWSNFFNLLDVDDSRYRLGQRLTDWGPLVQSTFDNEFAVDFTDPGNCPSVAPCFKTELLWDTGLAEADDYPYQVAA
jgi:hypothetical protein